MKATECPACGGAEFRRAEVLAGLAVETCRGCGLLVSAIRRAGGREIGSEFARVDEAAYRRAIGHVREQQAADVISLVRAHGPAGRDWLDVGCSFGYLLAAAARDGYEVFGVEPDELAFERARRAVGEARVRRGLMTDETRPDASADVISMMDVLEHIPAAELPGFAQMLWRKLRPGGLWLIKVPTTEGAYFKIAHRLAPFAPPLVGGFLRRLWQSDYEFPHTVYFSRATLALFLRRHGFEPIAHRYVEDVPNSTVLDRLRLDDTIPRWQAPLVAPAFYLVNFFERLRGKSDALVVLARRAGEGGGDGHSNGGDGDAAAAAGH